MCFFRYPKNLQYKILQRRGQCLAALGRQAEAEAALKEAVASLDNDVPKMPDNKRESLRRDINALIAEVRKQRDQPKGFRPKPEELNFKRAISAESRNWPKEGYFGQHFGPN